MNRHCHDSINNFVSICQKKPLHHSLCVWRSSFQKGNSFSFFCSCVLFPSTLCVRKWRGIPMPGWSGPRRSIRTRVTGATSSPTWKRSPTTNVTSGTIFLFINVYFCPSLCLHCTSYFDWLFLCVCVCVFDKKKKKYILSLLIKFICTSSVPMNVNLFY